MLDITYFQKQIGNPQIATSFVLAAQIVILCLF